MNKRKIVLASGNEGKVRELSNMINDPNIGIVSMKQLVPANFEVQETGDTFQANAWLKAEQVCLATGLPALADDSGLVVDALQGRPGVYSARYAGPHASDDENNALLVKELRHVPQNQRSARFVCALAFAVPAASLAQGGETAMAEGGESPAAVRRWAEAEGAVEGRIVDSARGKNGFGYDPYFECLAFPGRTTAEISPEQKNQVSHRGAALRAILPALLKWAEQSHGNQ